MYKFIIGLTYRFVLCLSVASFCGCVEAEKVKPLFPCTDKLENAYGVDCHLTFSQDYTRRDAELAMMNKIGINMVRGGSHFFALGYKGDEFNPLMMDSVVKSVENANIPMHGNLSMDAFGKKFWEDLDGYSRYVDYISNRYNGHILNWEVINEVDLTLKTDSSAFKYSQLLKRIYPIFKKDGRQNNVLISGLADVCSPFLDSLCQYEVYKYFDIMNFHTYDRPENFIKHFNVLRNMMDKYGWEKEVWLGECGMHTAPDTLKNDIWNDKEWLIQEQARRLPRIYLTAFAYGINKVFWYEIRSEEIDSYYSEHHFGLLHADLRPKPAFKAYETLIQMCPDRSTRPTLSVFGENYLASWITPKGETVYAAWSVSPIPLSIKVDGNSKYYDLYGKRIKKPQMLNSSIVYIRNAKNVSFKIPF